MSGILRNLRRWRKETDGVAATEFALTFPMMITLLLGVFDLGFGILAAQKTIRASQVTADLIARHKSVNDAEIMEAVEAGSLSLVPFPESGFRYRITSLEFTDDNGTYNVLWDRGSVGGDFPDFDADALAAEGQGLVVVQVEYTYRPFFSDFLFGDFRFYEVAFLKGRLSDTVPLES